MTSERYERALARFESTSVEPAAAKVPRSFADSALSACAHEQQPSDPKGALLALPQGWSARGGPGCDQRREGIEAVREVGEVLTRAPTAPVVSAILDHRNPP